VLQIKGGAGPAIEMMDLLSESCANHDLISDYFQRPRVNTMMEVKATALMKAVLPKDKHKPNTKWILEWFRPVFVAIRMMLSSHEVIDGDQSLGAFLATISVIKSIAKDVSAGYHD